jgi:hypothetical protein
VFYYFPVDASIVLEAVFVIKSTMKHCSTFRGWSTSTPRTRFRTSAPSAARRLKGSSIRGYSDVADATPAISQKRKGGALEGVRVLDLSRVLAVQIFCFSPSKPRGQLIDRMV